MFAQGIIGFLLLLGAAYAIWRIVIAPALKAKGIDIDKGDDIVNEDTKELEKMKAKYEDMKASSDAVEEMVELKKDIEFMEQKIKDKKNV